MKPFYGLTLAAWLAAGCSQPVQPQTGEAGGRMHHVAVVWLKQPGDPQARQRYIEASRPLARLPGVVAYDAGTPAAVRRSRANAALDESYDVAVSAVFESRQAYQQFLHDPEYLRVAQQVLRPLVEKYKLYEFAEPDRP
ncbi:Dabb family protein [Methylomonas sp. DH-1]|uniref:Dabb family protein n=1 Tax=Methylomonas sp. (strain DH-1) TaxID=1727196 RepID=UPI0007C894F7|nr:Dabb family protein [Methylomonas sp. DH-1]ANE56196.1 stress protein [Methylomonas sp. DH-1]